MKKLLTGLGISSFFIAQAFAVDILVSPDGALKSITSAAKLAKPGDTIIVAPGTYKENVSVRVSGRADARIKYVSQVKGKALIIGSGTGAAFLNYGSYVDIVDFDISGTGRLGIQNEGSFNSIRGNHVHDLKVSGGCTGAGGAGIVNSNYSASDNEIIGNIVHDVGIPGSCIGVQGIYHANLRGKVLNNIVYRASAFGIHLWHAADRVTVANNTVFANGSKTMGGGLVFGTGDAPGGVVLDNSQIVNNIIYDNPKASIITFCYKGEDCIGNNNLVSNNLVFKNGSGISLSKGTAFSTINAEPQFVNYQAAGNGNYHLLSTSPAIDKGLLSWSPATDMDGNSRSGAVDIGAFEFKSAVVTTPKAQFSASQLNFPATLVGSRSSAQVVTITSSGTAPLVLQSLNISGDFVLGNSTCVAGRSYAPGQNCSLQVTFAPVASGLRSGALSIQSNSNPALTSIALSGTAELAKPMIQLSSSTLSFGNVILGSTSAVQEVTVTNNGNAPLVFTQNFKLTGEFAFAGQGTCALNVTYAPKASCKVSVVFKPTVSGLRQGSLTLVSNASNPLVVVSLSGTGIIARKPILSVSVKALSFGNVKVGAKSVIKIITIKNVGTASLTINKGFAISGPFAFGGTGTCSVNASYAPGQSCTASLVFVPKVLGLKTGSITYDTNAGVDTTALSGTGIR